MGDLQAVLEGKTAFLEVGAVELHGHREIRAHRGAHRSDRIQQGAGAVGQFAAIPVVALVAARAEKLGKEVAVSGVNLYPGEAGLFHRRGADAETAHDILDFRFGEGHGFAELSPR